ncbi:DegT/DnrJ/EryC1/StrS family aminotransferase [Chitinophaga lutea]
MRKIEMVDLKGQYNLIEAEILDGIKECLRQGTYINGPQVKSFTANLSRFLDEPHVIPCANGTDALQIALMALDLQPGDEVILPAFTYAATAEVVALLRLTPVMIDVDENTFNTVPALVAAAITDKTRAIVPVHLFGQCVDLDPILKLAAERGISVIEDTAQAIGAQYLRPAGSAFAGTIGDIGCTSFFPSKNLGCYGDGGALMTRSENMAVRLKMIANHGQLKKYEHHAVGVNSRLDSMQAAILDVKLKHLQKYTDARIAAADLYDQLLTDIPGIHIPIRAAHSTHVFHQYTIRVANGRRDALKAYLAEQDIPAMIYYPIPLNEQEAYKKVGRVCGTLDVTTRLCREVLSLPMHTELTHEDQAFIADKIKSFFKK